MLAGRAARGSAPLRGGRWRGHPLMACAHSEILNLAGAGKRPFQPNWETCHGIIH